MKATYLRPLLLFMDRAAMDLLFGFRTFRRSPAVTLIAVLSLALGIGATTAMFSTVYSAVLHPFPYGDVDHLLTIQLLQRSGQAIAGFTPAQFEDLAGGSSTFLTLSGSRWKEVSLTGHGDPERLDGVYATANLFDVLEVRPILGRGFSAGDAQPESLPVVVLSYKCWQHEFAGETSILGKTIRIDNQVRAVIGVMPERVYWMDADVYMPVSFAIERDPAQFIMLLSRLKSGVTTAASEAKLNAVFRDIAHKDPTQFPPGWRAEFVSFPDGFPSTIKNNLWILLGAVGLLLLIGCANVSILLLLKANTRRKEMTIRMTVGAQRGRLLQQLLTESLLLAFAGCLLGLIFARESLHLMLAMTPQYTLPGEAKIGFSLPILLFSMGVSAVTAVTAGIVPALHGSGSDLAHDLRANSRGSAGSRQQVFTRQALVAGEVALSLILLVSAVLMLRTLFTLQNVPLGIASGRVLTLDIPLPVDRYKTKAERVASLKRYLAAIRETPGVVAVSLNTGLHPLGNLQSSVEVDGSSSPNAPTAVIHQVDQQYFPVFRIPLVEGRTWTETDIAKVRRYAIVNQAFERLYLSGKSAFGVSVRIPPMASLFGSEPFQIVGVTADVCNQGLLKGVAPEVYVPYTFTGMSRHLVVRTASDPTRSAPAILASIRHLDPEQLITNVMSMDALLEKRLLSLSRFELVLFGSFAAMGLMLAIAGIYGVVSNAVETRRRELGVRLALGARPGQLLGLVLNSGMQMVLLGIGGGIAGALLLTRLMASMLFGVRSADPLSIAAAVLVIAMAGLFSCLEPAMRATRIDPSDALQQE